MSVRLIGNLTLSAILPLALQASTQLGLVIGLGKAKIDAELPDISAKISANLDGIASLQAAILGAPLAPAAVVSFLANANVLALSIPDLVSSLTARLAALADVGASLSVKAATLNVDLGVFNLAADFAASLTSLLAKGGVRVYRYDGTFSGLGSQFTDAGGDIPPDTQVNAVLLVTDDAGAWAALQQLLKTT